VAPSAVFTRLMQQAGKLRPGESRRLPPLAEPRTCPATLSQALPAKPSPRALRSGKLMSPPCAQRVPRPRRARAVSAPPASLLEGITYPLGEEELCLPAPEPDYTRPAEEWPEEAIDCPFGIVRSGRELELRITHSDQMLLSSPPPSPSRVGDSAVNPSQAHAAVPAFMYHEAPWRPYAYENMAWDLS